MDALRRFALSALAVVLLVGPGADVASAVLSDELRITDVTGTTTLFSGFLDEGVPGEVVTSSALPLSILPLGAGSIKSPPFVFLFEPGHPELGSDQITVVDLHNGTFVITLKSDEPEIPLIPSDPKIEELGTLQEITDSLFITPVPFKVFVLSDVERSTIPEPGTLVLLGAGLVACAGAAAWKRARA